MISPEDKATLEKLTEEILSPTGLLEATYMQLDELLKKHPEAVSHFVDMFESGGYDEDRDVLAVIIVGHQAHPGVVHYLRNELGWKDADFKGTAAEGYKGKRN